VRFTGGAARSGPWRQIFAAALDLPMELPTGRELGALGSAILASVAIGRHPDLASAVAAMTRIGGEVAPDPALAALLARRYGIWRDLAQALAPHWDAVIDGAGSL
jgi:L-xylulokinase